MNEIGLTTSLSELNINSKADLEIIIQNVNLERLRNNPREINKGNLEKILINIL